MNKFKIFFRQMNYILNRRQKLLSILVFVLTSFGSVLEGLGVSVIIPVVRMILDPKQLAKGIIGRMFPFIINLEYHSQVIIILSGVIFLYIFKNVYFAFLCWLKNKYAYMIQRELSVDMLKSYMSRGYSFFLNNNYGNIHRGIEEDINSVYSVISSAYELLSDILSIGLICVILIISDWQMAMMITIISLLCIVVIYFFFRKKMYVIGQLRRKYSSENSQALLQCIHGIKDVIILRKQKRFVKRYESSKIGYQAAMIKSAMANQCPTYIIEGFSITGIMVMIGYNVTHGVNTAQYVSSLAALAVGAFRILPYLGKVMMQVNTITASMPSVSAVYHDLKDARAYSKEHPECDYKLIKDGLLVKDENEELFKNTIEFKNITFAYDNQPKGEYVLKNVTININKGQSIALIGASGAGKSTLVDVLLGLLTPQGGGIYVDGVNISKEPDEWARMVGYVPQSVFLCDATIKENVAFGEFPSEIDDDRVDEALKRAELKEFVNSLTDGVNTFVGDRGVRLSGGQRQRIAIARALYHRPEILILDEATSALDNETETAIMSAIDSLRGSVTMVIVAHRLTTIRNCDVIYEVRGGSVIKRDKTEILN